MKYLIIFTLLLSSVSYAGEKCSESQTEQLEDVVYEVNADIPSHLKGAKITVKLADGRESTVPAEKFMVVPRKQKTVLGQNKLVSKNVTCSKDGNKNLLMLEARHDVTELESSTTTGPNSQTISVKSKKELVPGVNYFRRELIGPVGAGIGIDTNGTPKGMLGVEF